MPSLRIFSQSSRSGGACSRATGSRSRRRSGSVALSPRCRDRCVGGRPLRTSAGRYSQAAVRPRPQQCCKIVPDSRLCHFQNAASTDLRARMAAPTRSRSKAGWRPRSRRGGVDMTTSPRRPKFSPPVTRYFECTRLHEQLIARAYQVLIPVVSRRLDRPRPNRNHQTVVQTVQSKVEGV